MKKPTSTAIDVFKLQRSFRFLFTLWKVYFYFESLGKYDQNKFLVNLINNVLIMMLSRKVIYSIIIYETKKNNCIFPWQLTLFLMRVKSLWAVISFECLRNIYRSTIRMQKRFPKTPMQVVAFSFAIVYLSFPCVWIIALFWTKIFFQMNASHTFFSFLITIIASTASLTRQLFILSFF